VDGSAVWSGNYSGVVTGTVGLRTGVGSSGRRWRDLDVDGRDELSADETPPAPGPFLNDTPVWLGRVVDAIEAHAAVAKADANDGVGHDHTSPRSSSPPWARH